MWYSSLIIFLFSLISIIAFPESESRTAYNKEYQHIDVRGNKTQNFVHLQCKANIKLNGVSYEADENVFLDFTIRNYGEEVIRVFPTLGKNETYQLVITDEDDNVIPLKEKVKIDKVENFLHSVRYNTYPSNKKKKNKKKVKLKRMTENMVGDYVKELIIHQGESFIRRLNLKDTYELKPNNKYYIIGYFYPNFVENKSVFIKTENRLVFSIKERKDERKLQQAKKINSVAFKGIQPEEVVHLFLSAEIQKNWGNYNKYINFPEYILGYDQYAVEYSKSSPHIKEMIIEEFKHYLAESRAGKLIYYKIIAAETISPTLAKVKVNVERQLNKMPSRYEYQYILKKDNPEDSLWKISNLVVRVKR
ncbi:MAG: hypothetical protein H7A23_08665 [Leptospiraceae bacterium]|nr:hypothetical protein [Leptospiraceae bacterium]MCP5494617.1 hypothetical protein [Leptospiraceae bacterium]